MRISDWSSDVCSSDLRTPASTGLAPGTLATVENIWTGQSGEAGVERFLADFAGVPAGANPDIWVDLAGGTLVKKAGYPVLHQKDMFRMVLDIRRQLGKPTDIRAQLRAGNRPFTRSDKRPVGKECV